ncbi:hypothetical protein F511_02097 [Dorcoceras hygrometricum]|nr:hypothetical protein F511_02097 [Dorcoceras hygrometricum]
MVVDCFVSLFFSLSIFALCIASSIPRSICSASWSSTALLVFKWLLSSFDQLLKCLHCGRYRQSGPRPDTRLLHHPALEGVTRSARTDSPRRIGRKQFSGEAAAAAAAAGGARRRRRITDSACKNQLIVVSVQYGPFNPYISIRSTTIGKSRVSKDPITMHTSWRSNSDIASVTRVSMTFRVVRTNQYNQDLGLIHSTNGNHLESPKEGSSIDHQVTIYLHAQNITMFPTNETWYFASQILVSNSGGLILILTAQSTRNSSEYTRYNLSIYAIADSTALPLRRSFIRSLQRQIYTVSDPYCYICTLPETQQTLDTPHNIAQQDRTGNPVVIDLTNDDSIQEQIFPSVRAAGGEATNDQPDVAQSDVVQPDVARLDVAQAETEEPEVAKVAVVKRKTVSKNKSATTVDKKADIALVQVVEEKPVSKKRPAVVPEVKIAKKKRTTSGKTVHKDQDLAIVSVALDVMPIQTVDHFSAMKAAHPPPTKRKAPKRKLKLTPDSDEDVVEKDYAMETVVMESDVIESDSAEDLAIRRVVEEPVVTKSDDIQIVVAECSPVATDEYVGPLSKNLTLIPDGMILPSLTSAEPTKIKFSSTIEIRGVEDGDWYRKNLPNIAPTDKGRNLSRSQILYKDTQILENFERYDDTLDSSREALPFHTTFGGCGWLVEEREVAADRAFCSADARASGDTALSSPCWDLLAIMRRVVNYHSSWARQRQPSAAIRCLMHNICILSYAFPLAVSVALRNLGFTARRGFNPAVGAPGGG